MTRPRLRLAAACQWLFGAPSFSFHLAAHSWEHRGLCAALHLTEQRRTVWAMVEPHLLGYISRSYTHKLRKSQGHHRPPVSDAWRTQTREITSLTPLHITCHMLQSSCKTLPTPLPALVPLAQTPIAQVQTQVPMAAPGTGL